VRYKDTVCNYLFAGQISFIRDILPDIFVLEFYSSEE